MVTDCLWGTIIRVGVRARGLNVRNDVEVLGGIPLTEFSKSLLKSFGVHAREHYPNCSYGVYPMENDTVIAIVLVANRYSPNNFW
jgi:hypothetical protein